MERLLPTALQASPSGWSWTSQPPQAKTIQPKPAACCPVPRFTQTSSAPTGPKATPKNWILLMLGVPVFLACWGHRLLLTSGVSPPAGETPHPLHMHNLTDRMLIFQSLPALWETRLPFLLSHKPNGLFCGG